MDPSQWKQELKVSPLSPLLSFALSDSLSKSKGERDSPAHLLRGPLQS
jgi:hypothetical protein